MCLQFLLLLAFSSSLLAHALPTMGPANSAHCNIQQDNWCQEQDQQHSRPAQGGQACSRLGLQSQGPG